MIELAASAWKLEILLAVQKLIEAGVDLPDELITAAGIQEYLRWHVLFRKRLHRFWKDAQAYAVEQPAVLRDLLRNFGLPSHNDWQERGGQFVGMVSRAHIDRYILGNSREPYAKRPRRLRRDFGLGPAAFVGPGWENLLILPYHDLPGKICGFLCVGSNNRRQPEYAFFPVTAIGRRTNPEAGLSMLETATQSSHPAFKNTLFVVTDVVAALRLQLRHLRESSLPLPLVISHYGSLASSRTVWGNLRRERTVCWSPYNVMDAVLQARFANALVSTATTSAEQLEYRLGHGTATEYLHRINREAAPWASVLRDRLRTLSRPEIETTLLPLAFTHDEFDTFLRGCNTELLDRLRDIRAHTGVVRQVKYQGRTVCENETGWVFSNGEIVSDAVIRINQVITSRQNRTYYRGVLLYKDREHPFMERADTIEEGGFQWAYNYLRDTVRVGLMQYFQAWNRRAAGLAVRFHAPDQIEGVDRVGWDQERQRFQFHDFAIFPGGKTDATIGCLFDDGVPAKGLPRPDGQLPRIVLQQLCEPHDEAGIVWATAIAIIANLISIPANQPRRGVLLDGDGAAEIGTAAASLMGCSVLLAGGNKIEHDSTHGWPVVIKSRSDKPLATGWLDGPKTSERILSMPTVACQTLGLRQTWNIVRCDRQLGSLQLSVEAVPMIIPYYLADLCRRRFLHEGQSVATVHEVFLDMCRWLSEQGGTTQALELGRTFLEPAGDDPCRYFVRLVAYAVGQGNAVAGYASKNPHAEICYLEEPPAVWISQAAISDTATELGGLPLDVLVVTKLLQETGALQEENRRHGQLGWQLHREWWDTYWKSHVSKE